MKIIIEKDGFEYDRWNVEDHTLLIEYLNVLSDRDWRASYTWREAHYWDEHDYRGCYIWTEAVLDAAEVDHIRTASRKEDATYDVPPLLSGVSTEPKFDVHHRIETDDEYNKRLQWQRKQRKEKATSAPIAQAKECSSSESPKKKRGRPRKQPIIVGTMTNGKLSRRVSTRARTW